MLKRMISICLVLCIISAMVPQVYAEKPLSGSCGEKVTWSITPDGKILTISGSGKMERPGYGSHNTTIEKVIIENGITYISAGAFSNTWNLTSVSIPDSVTEIGAEAFAYSENLKEITIPDSVTTVRIDLCHGCTSLRRVTMSANVTLFTGYLFRNCFSLREFVCPPRLETISMFVFENCTQMKRIYIPETVTYIGPYSFRNCPALAEVYYGGSEAQWNALQENIDDTNEDLLNATIYYNQDGFGDQSADGTLYVGSWAQNLAELANYQSEDGTILYDGTQRHLVLNCADIPYIETDMPLGLTIEIVGNCQVGEGGITMATNSAPQSLTLKGNPGATLNVAGDIVSMGDLTLDGITAVAEDIRCTPPTEQYATLGIFDSHVTADQVFCGSNETWVSRLSDIKIEESHLNAGEIRTENVLEKAPEIKLTRATIISPASGTIDTGSYQGPYGIHYFASLTGDHGERVLIEPVHPYHYTYDYSKSPYKNLEPDTPNTDNIVMAFTALSKLAYSTHGQDYFGKTVREFVEDGAHLEYKNGTDTIWNYTDYSHTLLYTELIGDFVIIDVMDNNENSGFYGVCLQNPEDGSYIIAYRGSQGGGIANTISNAALGAVGAQTNNDWSTDMLFAVQNELGNQFADALEFYNSVKAAAAGKAVILTGHSLGGALAGYVSLITGAPAIAIDGAVGQIIDVAFWQEYLFVGGFDGVGAGTNLVNVTDKIGVSVGADIIQATHPEAYPMITYEPAGMNFQNEQYSKIFNSHMQLSFITYQSGNLQLGERAACYYNQQRWSNDVQNWLPTWKEFIEDKIKGAALDLVLPPWLTAIVDVLTALSERGRVQLGSTNEDHITAPHMIMIDSFATNIQFGGDGADRLTGYSASDVLAAGGGGKSADVLDGQGGNDIYIIDRNSTYTHINDPGSGTIFLRGWDKASIKIIDAGEYVRIAGAEGSVLVQKKRSLFGSGGKYPVLLINDENHIECLLCENIFDINQANDSLNSACLLSARSGVQQAPAAMRLVNLRGAGEVRFFDDAGNLLTWENESGKTVSSFFNLTDDSTVYTDFGYFYGYNDANGDASMVLYLFNSGCTVEFGAGFTDAVLGQYDESESFISAERIVAGLEIQKGEKIKIITAGNDIGFYQEADGKTAPVKGVTTQLFNEKGEVISVETDDEQPNDITTDPNKDSWLWAVAVIVITVGAVVGVLILKRKMNN